MSDKPKKEEAAPEKGHGDKGKEAAADGAEKPKKGGLLGKTPVLLGIAMVVEAVVLFAGFKFLGGSPKSAGAEVAAADAKAEGEGHEEKKADDHGGGHEEKKAEEPAAGHDEKKPDAHEADAHADPHAEGGHAPAKVDKKRRVELTVVDFRAPNKQNGRMFLYDVTICIELRAASEEKTKAILTERAALIKDRIRTIIAQSDPEKLGGGSEPGLETLRRQVKYQLDEIVGEGVIDEVVVPRCIPFPVNN
jgi:flagellar basal body-associated protein FliL